MRLKKCPGAEQTVVWSDGVCDDDDDDEDDNDCSGLQLLLFVLENI